MNALAPTFPDVVFAPGALDSLPTQLAARGFRRAFIVTTRGRASGLVALKQMLGSSVAGVFSEAVEHVPIQSVDSAEAEVRAANPDVLVALGGGSPIGLGKALALRTDLPLIAIPTTYSGSEMTSIYGLTDATGKKTGRDSRIMPRLVIYDPLLTFELPGDVSASSGMNALAHSVEALYAPNATPETNEWAHRSVQLLSDNLPIVVAHPADVAARTAALEGSHLAGKALGATSMGLHHGICHVLGGSFGMPHAKTHAVILPYVARFNMSPAADSIRTLARNLPVPRSLRELGFHANDVDRAAKMILAGNYPNPRPVTTGEIVNMLTAALDGK